VSGGRGNGGTFLLLSIIAERVHLNDSSILYMDLIRVTI
jgi:hypothetical protein